MQLKYSVLQYLHTLLKVGLQERCSNVHSL